MKMVLYFQFWYWKCYFFTAFSSLSESKDPSWNFFFFELKAHVLCTSMSQVMEMKIFFSKRLLLQFLRNEFSTLEANWWPLSDHFSAVCGGFHICQTLGTFTFRFYSWNLDSLWTCVGMRIKLKNGLILPTGQWYALSAFINDAWYCMVLHCIA